MAVLGGQAGGGGADVERSRVVKFIDNGKALKTGTVTEPEAIHGALTIFSDEGVELFEVRPAPNGTLQVFAYRRGAKWGEMTITPVDSRTVRIGG